MTNESDIDTIVKTGIERFMKGIPDKMDEPVDKANEPEETGGDMPEFMDGSAPDEQTETEEMPAAEDEELTGEKLFERCTGETLNEASEDALKTAIEYGMTALGF